MSLFVSFEGCEGSGKTTQAAILLRRLEESGQPVIQLHEPGMTPLGTFARRMAQAEPSQGRDDHRDGRVVALRGGQSGDGRQGAEARLERSIHRGL